MSYEPRVFNKRTDTIPEGAVYVGRPSKWGNPFRITPNCPRGEAVIKFRGYAYARLDGDPHWLDELKGKDLVCWCSPEKCHADVLLELANEF